ncbi:MAG: CoA transferase [Armatimonadota bacterium]|nr:CoA transferase [Armatimonadota bacterium]MDR7452622.1 CoA transferase [Armatimonadota bacterium]MDR7467809.1 CoA transferase [Armatimonadota bacterium]MDR7494605.1 CoA transferase [Armatimonadota bacterium]MDR7499665.1 CoA transferase [Armatimonadota bacterium]
MGQQPPLDDLLVVDLTRALAGPFCTVMLGDLGARVIKVETPEGGDDTRGWGPPFVGEESAYFLSVNRNKESLTLNIKDPRGREILRQLLRRADVLVENFRPGVMERLGLGYTALHEEVPRLIYAAISGFGQDGPYRERTAYDLILQGMGGVMGITGEEGGPPVKVGVAIADICAGMYAAYGILAALRVRERTGQGQLVDVALLDGQVSWLTYAAGYYFATGENPGRLGSAHPTIVPYQAFQTADGYLNVAVGSEAIWRRFAELLDPALLDDPRFATNRDRVAHRRALIDHLQGLFLKKTTRQWTEALDAAGVPCGPILTVAEVFADPQVRHRGMLQQVDHPTVGPLRQTGLPVKFSATPGRLRLPPPTLGQHTEAILGELGYDPAAITRLREDRVV